MIKPVAWMCELMQEDGSVRTMFVTEDPAGLRWGDADEPSPFKVTPLVRQASDLTDDEIKTLRVLAEAEYIAAS